MLSRAPALPAADPEAAKLAELDRIINDPDVPIDPDRVWALIGEIARAERTTRPL